MNELEQKMSALLKELKDNYNATGIRIEFEAAGMRIEEAMRFKDINSSAGLSVNVKIGGCEAVKDMFDALNLGAKRIIAPMVETPYALQKFLYAARKVYGAMLENVRLLINIETITAFNNLDDMLKIPEIKYLNGIVIGRVDFAGSLGLTREDSNGEIILNKSLEISRKAKEKNLEVVVGGVVSPKSLPFFKAFPKGHLDCFETRQIVFEYTENIDNISDGLNKAVEFELLWLKNKRDYYLSIAREDEDRIKMMEERCKD